MNQEEIEISFYHNEGYKPVIDYMEWRVAILNYCEELEPQNIHSMQKHMETDEVFVLLAGNCRLFTGGKGEHIEHLNFVDMEQGQLYNIKRGVWHTHSLDRKGCVLIVENRNTNEDNSPIEVLPPDFKIEYNLTKS